MASKKRSLPDSSHRSTPTSRHTPAHTPSFPFVHPQPVNTLDGLPRSLPANLHQPITTSVFHPSFQATLVDPSLQSHAVIAASPVPSSEGTAPESSSRRQSSSTMRTSSVPFEGPPTATPTGRISKAKKGKRVHACAYDGCGKVFTRAEHRRRHELNHNPEAMFPCDRAGCRKAFHRLDLLQRHQERHDLETQLESQNARMSHASTPNEVSGMPPSSMPGLQDGPNDRASSGGLSIGSLVHPQSDYRYRMGTPSAYSAYSRSTNPYGSNFPATDDSMYYTPESSQSPASDQYGRYPHRKSISSSSSVAAYDSVLTSPMIHGANTWVPSSAPPNVLPTHLFEDQAYLTSHADTSLPIPLTNLDGADFEYIRRELSNAPGIISTSPGSDLPNGIRRDAIRWDCLELYWQHFHPYYPIIHRPTFLPTKPSPLLASAMVAIGSQFDDREDAKHYSLTLLDLAINLLQRRDNITSRSRLADLQTVFLLEILSKYCSRRVEVEMSTRFRQLYASLDQAKRTLSTSSLAVFRTLGAQPTKHELYKAHKFFVDHESRRRLFQAFSVLDKQHELLFEQPPTIKHHNRTRLSTDLAKATMSLPCSDELWSTSPVEDWFETAKTHEHLEQTGLEVALHSGKERKLGYFQMHTWLQSDENTLQQFCYDEVDGMLPLIQKGGACEAMTFDKHALAMAKQTPIRILMLVSGESRVFGRKEEQATDSLEAKHELRAWVNEGLASLTALWHALALLRGQFIFSTDKTHAGEVHMTATPTRTLHEPWAIYLACLVCWAHGLYPALASGAGSGHHSRRASAASIAASNHSSSSHTSGHPALMEWSAAAHQAQTYLDITDVAQPEYLAEIEPASMGRMHGLLEVVRRTKIRPLMGGLMNEAETVLYRLVEGRSNLSHF